MKIEVFTLLFSVSAPSAFSHGPHGGHKAEKQPSDRAQIVSEIGVNFEKDIKPIFDRSCADCHSQSTKYPFYYKVPGARQLIDHDVKEAKEHLDMTDGFPFKGHGTLEEDLKAIRETITKNEMPPWRYRILHSKSKLSKEDNNKIIQWVENAEMKLKK